MIFFIIFQDENITSNSDSEPKKDKRPSFNRSKSLDHEVQRKLDRQQSSDTDGGGTKGRSVEFSGLPYRKVATIEPVNYRVLLTLKVSHVIALNFAAFYFMIYVFQNHVVLMIFYFSRSRSETQLTEKNNDR